MGHRWFFNSVRGNSVFGLERKEGKRRRLFVGVTMFGFIFGLIIGGFLGVLGMALCVICRDRKAEFSSEELLAACKRLQRYNKIAKVGGLNPDTAADYWDSVMCDIEVAIDKAKKNE